MNVAQAIPFKAEGPQPLIREIPPGQSYPVHALGPLRSAVEDVQEATQAPVAIAAQSALSVASLAVQAHADVESLGGFVPLSLYCLTIAQSGERKSGCDRMIMQALRDYERSRASEYREADADYQRAHKLWSAKRDRMVKEAAGTNKAKATSAEADLRTLGSEPKPPLSPKLTTEEPTFEGLVKLYLNGRPSLGLFSDEGGGFLGGHAMNSDNRLKTVAGFSKLFSGDSIDRVRAGDGATTLYGRRLAMHLMVQPVAARPLLSDPVASGQGFLARFLITEPHSAIGTRLGEIQPNVANVAIVAASVRLSEILGHPLPTSENCPQELDPRQLTLSPEARELLVQYYRATEIAQASGGDLEQVRSFASKSPEQAARIAGVLTLWKDLGASSVSSDVMSDAIELAQFYLLEAKRLSEAALISDDINKAESLRRWIKESWPMIAVAQGRDEMAITPRDVVISGPNSLRVTSIVKNLMKTLEAHGWLAPLEPGTVVDGQARRTAYRIVRE